MDKKRKKSLVKNFENWEAKKKNDFVKRFVDFYNENFNTKFNCKGVEFESKTGDDYDFMVKNKGKEKLKIQHKIANLLSDDINEIKDWLYWQSFNEELIDNLDFCFDGLLISIDYIKKPANEEVRSLLMHNLLELIKEGSDNYCEGQIFSFNKVEFGYIRQVKEYINHFSLIKGAGKARPAIGSFSHNNISCLEHNFYIKKIGEKISEKMYSTKKDLILILDFIRWGFGEDALIKNEKSKKKIIEEFNFGEYKNVFIHDSYKKRFIKLK